MRKSTIRATVMAIALSLSLSACQMNKETGGSIFGAGLGGLLGSQIGSGKGKMVAIGAGVLGGLFIGKAIGASLDKADKLYAKRNAQNTLEQGRSYQATGWQNPDSGHSGTFTPGPVKHTTTGVCRPYETTIFVNGKRETGTGSACRNPNGTWTIQ